MHLIETVRINYARSSSRLIILFQKFQKLLPVTMFVAGGDVVRLVSWLLACCGTLRDVHLNLRNTAIGGEELMDIIEAIGRLRFLRRLELDVSENVLDESLESALRALFAADETNNNVVRHVVLKMNRTVRHVLHTDGIIEAICQLPQRLPRLLSFSVSLRQCNLGYMDPMMIVNQLLGPAHRRLYTATVDV